PLNDKFNGDFFTSKTSSYIITK
ncbi:Nicotinamide riboside transporter PnuC, partial [Haemophilus influenzae]